MKQQVIEHYDVASVYLADLSLSYIRKMLANGWYIKDMVDVCKGAELFVVYEKDEKQTPNIQI